MKALIICSVHALCDIAELERDACNRACALHGLPAVLTAQDHRRVLANATLLDVLNHLPGSKQQRQALTKSYLEILNEEVWSTSICAYKSVFAALLNPKWHARPRGFVSEYPILTTNLIRSSALLTSATKLGSVTALSDRLEVKSIAASLEASAHSLNVAHDDVEVLVAHQRDFIAAQSIGMHPRFVDGLQKTASAGANDRTPITASHKRSAFTGTQFWQPVAVSA